ncbi:tetratricopeptide repeat protein [Winogradskyella flava]|uniref:Tetratricopeptide repeat protein n=1 Tax=Winogradskyella flava TaxID=1884876 RepID=A0A842IWR5_9FLAO|nr:tetratricopeptide repeat protein [Winogradskyella flava]MBC2846133.1 tetratricopeptide repeat protein [Winogradskyella flava]
MKFKVAIFPLLVASVIMGCSKSIEYSEQFKKETSGKYLYNPDELILVYYEDNKLRLNWKGGDIEPVTLEMNEFFIPDMYKKFRFVQHPETNERYLSAILEDDEDKITYDYLKVADSYKTPSQYLAEGDFEKALAGYMKIKKQDSTSSYINEWDFNRTGYKHLRKKEYDKAIGVFELNVKLHPNSDNVYDSLADAYLTSGDSLQAYHNYKVALEINPRNKRAERFLNIYSPKED